MFSIAALVCLDRSLCPAFITRGLCRQFESKRSSRSERALKQSPAAALLVEMEEEEVLRSFKSALIALPQ